jgi:DNA recombination protein RmuC
VARWSLADASVPVLSCRAVAAAGALDCDRAARRLADRPPACHALEVELAAARAELASSEEIARERTQTLDLALERLRSGFDSVAGDALRSNSELFLQIAREMLGQQQQLALRNLTDREKSVEGMLAPVREALQKTHEQITRIERERAESFGALRSSIEGVTLGRLRWQRETRNLVTALRRPEVRGRWGEMTLRRLAELAGMVEHCDFAEQVHLAGEERSLRPDMIVNMPDGRQLVVDVKTPLDAYLSAIEAGTEEERALAVRRHAQAVVERVKQLSSKAYWAQFERSPDFVVLFIPGDQFLTAAVAEIPNLLEDAIRQDVIIATPTSFVALLKAVAYGWRQNVLADNAVRIRELAEELYRRLPLSAHTWRASAGRSGRASTPITAPWARSSTRCCPARASSRSSAAARPRDRGDRSRRETCPRTSTRGRRRRRGQ